MGAQDNTDKVLRKIHMMLSKSDVYQNEPGMVIVDKRQFLTLLKELNDCISEMEKEYELTIQSRKKAETQARRKNQQMESEAKKRAEDVYAASVMYTDEALGQICEIIKGVQDSMENLYQGITEKIQEQERTVRDNQLELRSQLQDLADAEMYTQIIDDQNRKREREKEKLMIRIEKEQESSGFYDNRIRAVQINHDIVERLREEKPEGSVETPFDRAREDIQIRNETAREAERQLQEPKGIAEENQTDLDSDISIVDLDAEYFQWKDTGK